MRYKRSAVSDCDAVTLDRSHRRHTQVDQMHSDWSVNIIQYSVFINRSRAGNVEYVCVWVTSLCFNISEPWDLIGNKMACRRTKKKKVIQAALDMQSLGHMVQGRYQKI